MVGKRKGDGLVFWVREGKRMKRLEEPALLSDSEILMLDAGKVQQKLLHDAAISQPIPNTGGQTAWTPALSGLASLPHEILSIIVESLSVGDVENLSQVCRQLKAFVENSYVLHVMLPCSEAVLRHCRQRKVLRITSCCCLRTLKNPVTKVFQFEGLNVRDLKGRMPRDIFGVVTWISWLRQRR
jgi:hypothetical protein